jgi:hypothetical protein
MKIKIEFTKSRSGDFERVLGLIRRIKSFSEESEKGITLYSVEFSEADLDSAQAVMDLLRTWKSVVFFMDGKLVPRFKAVTYVWDKIYADYQNSRSEAQKRWDVEGGLQLRKTIREAKSPKDLLGNQTPPPKNPEKEK